MRKAITVLLLLPLLLAATYRTAGLDNVFPIISVDYVPNGRSVYSKFDTEFLIRNAAVSVTLSDLRDILFREFCPTNSGPDSTSSFGNSVGIVFDFSSQEQMGWVTTCWVIPAWAVVKNTQSIRNWAIGEFPRQAVSHDPFSFRPTDGKTSVTTVARSPSPKDTASLGWQPETFLKKNFQRRSVDDCTARERASSSLMIFDFARTDKEDFPASLANTLNSGSFLGSHDWSFLGRILLGQGKMTAANRCLSRSHFRNAEEICYA